MSNARGSTRTNDTGGGAVSAESLSKTQIDRAVDSATQALLRKPVPFVIDSQTCKIPKFIYYRQCVVLNVNRDTLYSTNASRIDQLKPSAVGVNVTMEVLLQMFGRIAEVCYHLLNGKSTIRQQFGIQRQPSVAAPARKGKKKNKKKRQRRDAYGDDDDDDVDDSDTEVEDSGSENDDKNEAEPEVAAPYVPSSFQPFQVFLETLMRDTRDSETNDPFNLKPVSTGVRYWLVNNSPEIDLNAILIEIIDKNNQQEQKKADLAATRGRRGGGNQNNEKNGSDSDSLPWDQRWRSVTQMASWKALCDFNVQRLYALRAQEYDRAHILKGAAPVSLTNAFSHVFALHNVSADTWICQGVFSSADDYVQRIYDDAHGRFLPRRTVANEMVLHFPRPEFVYRVPPQECNAYGFMCRYFPDVQRSAWLAMSKLFPEDFSQFAQSSDGIETGAMNAPVYQAEYEMTNPNLDPSNSRPKTFRIISRKVDIKAEERRLAGASVDDDAFERALLENGLSTSEIAELRKDDVETESVVAKRARTSRIPATRSDALYQMAETFNVVDYANGDEKIERFDLRSLATANRMFEAAQMLTEHEIYEQTSPFALLNRDAAQVRSAISKSMHTFSQRYSPARIVELGLASPEMRARVMALIAQMQALTSYERTCRSPASSISPTGRIVHAYRLLEDIYKSAHKVRPFSFDPEMGAFANRMCAVIVRLIDIFKLSKNAAHCQMLSMVVLDAFRHAYSIHYNVIHYGPGAAGKSNLFDLIEKYMMIEETMEKLTRQTMAADSVDGDGNDKVRTFHELQMSRFESKAGGKGAGGGGANDVASGFKEFITSMESRVVIPVMHANGTRSQRVIIRKAISVFLGNTNADFDEVDDAMLSRFHFKSFETGSDDITEILAAMIEEEHNKASICVARDAFSFEMKLFQVLHYEVEKCIHTGVLHQVSQHAGGVFQQLVLSVLKRRGIAPTHVRYSVRNLILARLYCISEALYDHFFRPGAPYQNREITISAFPSLDQRLFIQVPHMIYVLGLTEDQLVPTFEVQVIRGLKHLLMQQQSPFDVNAKEFTRQKDLLVAETKAQVQNNAPTSGVFNGVSGYGDSGGNNNNSSQTQLPYRSVPLNTGNVVEDSVDGYEQNGDDRTNYPDEFYHASEHAKRFMLTNENNDVLDASYYRFLNTNDYDRFIDSVLNACKAVAHGHGEPTRGMVSDALKRFMHSNYETRNFVFANQLWPDLSANERAYVKRGGFLRTVDSSMPSVARPVLVKREYNIALLCEFLDDRIAEADDEECEGAMSAAIREVMSKRGQFKGMYVFGQEVAGLPELLKRLYLGPGCTREETLRHEGYWRNAQNAAVTKQRTESKLPPKTKWIRESSKRRLNWSSSTFDMQPHELQPMVVPNFEYSEDAKKLLRRAMMGNFEISDTDRSWQTCFESYDRLPTNDNRLVEIDMSLDMWGAARRCIDLNITMEAVPSEVVLCADINALLKKMRSRESQSIDAVVSSETLSPADASTDADAVDDEDIDDSTFFGKLNDTAMYESVHVEGECYFMGKRVLHEDDEEVAKNSGSVFGDAAQKSARAGVAKKVKQVEALTNIEIRPDPTGKDFDFNEEHFYVPIPRHVLLNHDRARELLTSARYSNPNPGTVDESLPSITRVATKNGNDKEVLWVPFWIYVGMSRGAYKIHRYVWYIESMRQQLWQQFSGDYDYVVLWSYPGDLCHVEKKASVWDACVNQNSEQFRQLAKSSMGKMSSSLRLSSIQTRDETRALKGKSVDSLMRTAIAHTAPMAVVRQLGGKKAPALLTNGKQRQQLPALPSTAPRTPYQGLPIPQLPMQSPMPFTPSSQTFHSSWFDASSAAASPQQQAPHSPYNVFSSTMSAQFDTKFPLPRPPPLAMPMTPPRSPYPANTVEEVADDMF